MTDFWLKHRGNYPALDSVRLPSFNWRGLGAYAIGSTAAYFSPLLPPVVGVLAATIGYAVLLQLSFGTTSVRPVKS